MFRKKSVSEAGDDMTRQPVIARPSPLNVKETARALGLSPYTVRSWIAQRRLGHVRLGRSVRVPMSEVTRILDDNFRPAKSMPGRGSRGHD